MRVAHILARLSHSGAERMLACSYEYWQRAGFESTIIGMADGEHPFADVLAKQGYGVLTLPNVRTTHGLVALRRALKVVRPDIVHIHQDSCFDAVALIARLSPGVAGIVRTVHNQFRLNGALRVRRTIRTAFTRRLGVIWVSCADETAETELTFSANATRVVEEWADVDGIAGEATPEAGSLIRSELGIGISDSVIGLIGNCSTVKNHELIPTALAEVAKPAHVLHIGSDSSATPIEAERWKRLPEQHTVHHLGTRDDVNALLAACDLTVVPSLYEGMCVAAIESLSAGVPVIAADTCGLRWLLSMPGARLVSYDPREWAVAIEEELCGGHRIGREHIAAAARERFNPRLGVEKYVAIYEETLRHRRRNEAKS